MGGGRGGPGEWISGMLFFMVNKATNVSGSLCVIIICAESVFENGPYAFGSIHPSDSRRFIQVIELTASENYLCCNIR